MSLVNLYFDDDPAAEMLPTERTEEDIKADEEIEKFKQKVWKRVTLRQRGDTHFST